jgi:imidazole glycerol-phosphate synthase subunit HisH
MKIVIIKYPAGNIKSVAFALRREGVEPIISADSGEISSADKVIFPGVGEAGTTMAYLNRSGLSGIIKSLKQPVLGICLGMQLMCDFLEEGNVQGLGIFPVSVLRFNKKEEDGNKIPHMGWNNTIHKDGNIFKGVPQGEHLYFVHSYYAGITTDTIAQCHYINDFSAALQRDNFYGVQFHPEKSGSCGALILKNFLTI